MRRRPLRSLTDSSVRLGPLSCLLFVPLSYLLSCLYRASYHAPAMPPIMPVSCLFFIPLIVPPVMLLACLQDASIVPLPCLLSCLLSLYRASSMPLPCFYHASTMPSPCLLSCLYHVPTCDACLLLVQVALADILLVRVLPPLAFAVVGYPLMGLNSGPDNPACLLWFAGILVRTRGRGSFCACSARRH